MTVTIDQDVKKAFEIQAFHCRDLGSPFVARLCDLFAERLTPGNNISDKITALIGQNKSAVPLRIAGALHYLVISKQCGELSCAFPPHHEAISDNDLWNIISYAMIEHEEFMLKRLEHPPQTNEIRRTAALLPGFLTIQKLTRLPFVLSEIGSSAGLNLYWDKFNYQLGSLKWGDPGSPVKLHPEWSGDTVPDLPITIVDRGGCDISPLNLNNNEDKNRLLSYIWADQADRFNLTESAIGILKRESQTIAKMNATDWVSDRLQEKFENCAHVIYHTIVWQYLDTVEQEKVYSAIEAAGMNASENSPIAWLRLESDEKSPGAALTLTLWPDGSEKCIARADYHGRWVNWAGW